MKKLFTTVLLATLMGTGTTIAAPTLNSYPTATATIYLDFDGHSVNSSMWNYGTPFVCAPSAMTDAQVTEAFNRVSEDFRPFNINVTTDLAKFLAAPLDQRIRVVVTPTSAWYPSVAGIAYVTSFTWGDDTPCFVFSDRLANDAKRVAEGISHETGHTLGLYHQSSYTTSCTLTSSYHTGIGTGQISWGPIMGNVASRNMTQWNYGPTPNGCNFKQDNLNIITTSNGFDYRPDDYGDIYSTSGVVNVASGSFSKVGVITTTADRDIFRIDLNQMGSLKLNAEPYSVGASYSGANLDIKLELQDAKGNTIKVYDYNDSVHAKLDTTLAAGTYYVIVDGTSNVNSANDYGSLGSYTISGTYKANSTTVTIGGGNNINTASNILSGSRVKEGNKIEWKAGSVKSTEAITLMYATEGAEFAELSRPDATTSNYVHATTNNAVFQYKLQITDKTGAVRFSNTIQIDPKTTNTGSFKIIRQPQQPVMINATQAFEYQVVDNNGRMIQAGKAAAGTKTIDVRNYPAGIYNLKLTAGTEQRTEKFMNR